MTDLDSIIQALTPKFKLRGYKKNRLTWYKEKPYLTIVFSIEKSRYSKTMWYYWFGIYLHDLEQVKNQSIGNCQIKYRVDNVINNTALSEENIAKLLERWETMYGDICSLKHCAIQGKLPVMSTLGAKTYLTSVDLSQYYKQE